MCFMVLDDHFVDELFNSLIMNIIHNYYGYDYDYNVWLLI